MKRMETAYTQDLIAIIRAIRSTLETQQRQIEMLSSEVRSLQHQVGLLTVSLEQRKEQP